MEKKEYDDKQHDALIENVKVITTALKLVSPKS